MDGESATPSSEPTSAAIIAQSSQTSASSPLPSNDEEATAVQGQAKGSSVPESEWVAPLIPPATTPRDPLRYVVDFFPGYTFEEHCKYLGQRPPASIPHGHWYQGRFADLEILERVRRDPGVKVVEKTGNAHFQ